MLVRHSVPLSAALSVFLCVTSLHAALRPASQAAAPQAPAATSKARIAEFKQLAAELTERRRAGAEEPEELQARALALLDAAVFELLAQPDASVTAINAQMRTLVTRDPPVGESYELILLGTPRQGRAYYALVVNFSQSGPSAVRVFAPDDAAGQRGFRLAGRIDRFAQPDFFDEYLELVPIKASDVVFVTAAGRTDEQRTGSFAAWRLNRDKLEQLWNAELLEQSAYEVTPAGFHLTFCAQPDENGSGRCRLQARERWVWDGYNWRRAERTEVPPK